MIGASVFISVRFIKQIWWTPAVFLAIFLVFEILYYKAKFTIWNENEKVRDIYNCMFRLLPKEGVHTQSADLTEGYFKCNYEGTSAEQAMRNKYDKIFELLQLKPGMRVIDLGCGHGQWMTYLREHGVDAVGVTLSNDQYNNLQAKGFTVILHDFTQLPTTWDGKFDAITAIGSFEHVAKDWMSHEEAKSYMTGVMRHHQRLFKKDSPCQRCFMSVITFDTKYKHWSLKDRLTFYVLERTNSGYYFKDYDYKSMAENTMAYKTEVVANLTEDYRYISIVNPYHFGDSKYSIGLSEAMFCMGLVLYDPFWIHRLMSVFLHPWMWQFGGNKKQVISNSTPRPCMMGWYVFKHEKDPALAAFAGTCNEA